MEIPKFEKRQPLYRQIATHFEEQIYSRRLEPGERLPSTAKLAKEFGVTVDTMQQSLTILSERGLIERQQKRGTFVSNNILNKTIGLVFGKRIFTDRNYAFFNLFLDEVTNYLEKIGWDSKYYSLKNDGHFSKFIHEMEKDIRDGDIRGFFEFCSDFNFRDYIKNNHCPVPWYDNILDVDFTSFMEMSLNYLISLGSKNIAVITPIKYLEIEKLIVDAVVDISGRHEAVNIDISTSANTDEEGYEAIKKVLSNKNRPDAIVICRDGASPGVIYGLLEAGIKVPTDVTLLTHRNKGINIFSPQPLIYLETDPADFAKAAVTSLIAKINGDELEPMLITPKLITP